MQAAPGRLEASLAALAMMQDEVLALLLMGPVPGIMPIEAVVLDDNEVIVG